MINKYVDAISSALQEYQTGIEVPYATALQEYKDLAWYGLKETKVLQINQKLKEIESKIDMIPNPEEEVLGGQLLIGKPCN